MIELKDITIQDITSGRIKFNVLDSFNGCMYDGLKYRLVENDVTEFIQSYVPFYFVLYNNFEKKFELHTSRLNGYKSSYMRDIKSFDGKFIEDVLKQFINPNIYWDSVYKYIEKGKLERKKQYSNSIYDATREAYKYLKHNDCDSLNDAKKDRNVIKTTNGVDMSYRKVITA